MRRDARGGVAPFWWEGDVETPVCPVLAFTPEAEQIRFWFDQTHEVEAMGMGGGQCRVRRLPGPGSVGDQDGWLWEALTLCRRVMNQVLQEQTSKTSRG